MSVRLNLSAQGYQGWSKGSITSLMGKGNGISSLLGEYSSIRSGSLYKAAKIYYRGLETGNSSVHGKTTAAERKEAYQDPLRYKKAAVETKNAGEVTKAGEDAARKAVSDTKSLSSAVSRLTADGKDDLFTEETARDDNGRMKTGYDRDSIDKAIKEFASAYNSVISDTTSRASSSMHSAVSSMKGYTSANAGALKEIGIEVESDGKLSVDDEALRASDPEKAKKLFKTDYGYGKSIERLSRQAENGANSGLSLNKLNYSADGTYQNSYLASWYNQYT